MMPRGAEYIYRNSSISSDFPDVITSKIPNREWLEAHISLGYSTCVCVSFFFFNRRRV